MRINRDMIQWECCISAFLRGVFFLCGTITNPEKRISFRFVVPYMNLANDFEEFALPIFKSWNYSRLLPIEKVVL